MKPEIARFVGGVAPHEVVVWSGAGLSMPWPTCLPSGHTLTEQALDWGFVDNPLSVLCGPVDARTGRRDESLGLYSMLDVNRLLPRLEVVLGAASMPAAHGASALQTLLEPMIAAQPNWLHTFMHQHCHLGGRHITANFDTCIERAGSEDVASRVIHFHGSVDDPLDSLGATFRNVEQGLAAGLSNRIVEALTAARLVVFVGYSGSDVFDIAPLFNRLAESVMVDSTVLWVEYVQGQSLDVSVEAAVTARPETGSRDAFLADERVEWALRQRLDLRLAGANVIVVRGDPAELFETLADSWSIPIEPKSGPCVEGVLARPAALEQQVRATVGLWEALGLQRLALAVMREHPQFFGRQSRLEAAAQYAWQQGQYSKARRTWAEGRPRATPTERAAWDERQVASLWVSGRLLYALMRVRRAIRRAGAANVASPELFEIWGRINEHMRRTPELRWLARHQRAKAAQAIDEASTSQSLGLHMNLRLKSVRAALEPREDQATPDNRVRSQFLESESLIGLLNYRHGFLRREIAVGEVPSDRYRDLERWFRIIGVDGDANRVPFLPGAVSAFRLRECIRAAFANEFGNWHRLRLISASIARHAARRLRELDRREADRG